MNATAPKASRSIDWSKPITEQFGGRFLTPAEANPAIQAVDREVIQYVEMNLNAVSDAVFGPEILPRSELVEVAPPMTFEQLGVLLNFAFHVEMEAGQPREWAQSIRRNVIRLFNDDDVLAAGANVRAS
jgi:hypothetical protein